MFKLNANMAPSFSNSVLTSFNKEIRRGCVERALSKFLFSKERDLERL
jgi:hypothetical protein